MKNQKSQIILVAALVLLTAFWRVACTSLGLYNIVPVAAIGLFSGSILQQKKWAYLIPLGTMLLSDMMFALFTNTAGFYGISQFVNYAALAVVTFLGTFLTQRKSLHVIGYTLSGSMIFFILSNLGTFLTGYYGYSVAGFTTCYAMAIPFYKSELATQFFANSFIGDMAFSLIAFGIYSFAFNRQMKLQGA